MSENESRYEVIHDNPLAEKIYTISGVTSVQLRIYPQRQENPLIGNAVFDIRLNADGSVEITNLAKNYRVAVYPV